MSKNNLALAFLTVAVLFLFWMVLGLQSALESNTEADAFLWEYQDRVNRANNLSPYR